jgi:hypothetical protein
MYDSKLGRWEGVKTFMSDNVAVVENMQERRTTACSTTLSVIDCGASNGRMSDEVEMISKKLDVV